MCQYSLPRVTEHRRASRRLINSLLPSSAVEYIPLTLYTSPSLSSSGSLSSPTVDFMCA